MYIEIDQTAVPYKYLSSIRAKGAFNDTISELMTFVRNSGKIYYRHIEMKESVQNGVIKPIGLQIETCLGNGIAFEQEPLSVGFAERSSHFRHARQSTLVTMQQSLYHSGF